MFLSTEMKQEQDARVRLDIPNFAEDIIKERRIIRKWEIQKWVCVDPVPTYPGTFAWQFIQTFEGDEDDAISMCFELKNRCKPGYMNCHRAIPYEI